LEEKEEEEYVTPAGKCREKNRGKESSSLYATEAAQASQIKDAVTVNS